MTMAASKKKLAASLWACPDCGAKHQTHGKGDYCKLNAPGHSSCDGLVCECWEEGVDEILSGAPDHGISFANPCVNANCYHCGWGGSLPVKPKGLLPWEKKALEAGWAPPAKRKKELGI